MKVIFQFKNENRYLVRHKFVCTIYILSIILFLFSPAMAKQLELFGKPLNVSGYINQSAAYGLNDNQHDTMDGFQQALFQFLLETKYEASPELDFFVSGMVNADLAYNILDGDSDWEGKHMDQSKSELGLFSDYEDILREMHVTWAPGNFIFRLGKQIVSWGETDGVRLADQINPQDKRRGITDVEFESSISPIWLAKAEYWFDMESAVVTDFGIEFVFNPNADFIPTKKGLGNDEAGIWGPYLRPEGGLLYFGSMTYHIDEPDTFDSDGFEFGVRLRAIIADTIVSLIYFNGVDDNPALVMTGATVTPDSSGRLLLNPIVAGDYRDFEYVGITLTRELPALNSKLLGGVAPVVRFESIYAFDTSFGDPMPMSIVEEHDEFRWALGVDWKVKIPFLNPKAYFMVSPQFISHSVMDYPSFQLTYDLDAKDDNNYMTTLMINTTYMHNKLKPFFFWQHDITHDADLFIFKLGYEYSHNWDFTLGAAFMGGDQPDESLFVLENKDHVFFTIAYRF